MKGSLMNVVIISYFPTARQWTLRISTYKSTDREPNTLKKFLMLTFYKTKEEQGFIQLFILHFSMAKQLIPHYLIGFPSMPLLSFFFPSDVHQFLAVLHYCLWGLSPVCLSMGVITDNIISNLMVLKQRKTKHCIVVVILHL